MSQNGLTRRHRRNINCLLGLQFSRTIHSGTVWQGITNGLSAAPTHIARIIYADGSERLAQQPYMYGGEKMRRRRRGRVSCTIYIYGCVLQAFRHTQSHMPCRRREKMVLKSRSSMSGSVCDERRRLEWQPEESKRFFVLLRTAATIFFIQACAW
jgi:hypothetical protein